MSDPRIFDASGLDPIAGQWIAVDERENSSMVSCWTEHLCVQTSEHGIDLAICVNGALGDDPGPPWEDEDEQAPGANDDYKLPAFFDGELVATSEDGLLCGPFLEREIATDVQRASSTIKQAVGSLGWDTDDEIVGAIFNAIDRKRPASALPAHLVSIYVTTVYHAADPRSSLELRLGEPSTELAELYEREGRHTAAFVTAWNPWGEALADDSNARRHRMLMADVVTLGLPFLEGEGRGIDVTWAPEKSLLVLGMTLEQAVHLGRHHQQNAIVWAAADAIPKLVLLR